MGAHRSPNTEPWAALLSWRRYRSVHSTCLRADQQQQLARDDAGGTEHLVSVLLMTFVGRRPPMRHCRAEYRPLRYMVSNEHGTCAKKHLNSPPSAGSPPFRPWEQIRPWRSWSADYWSRGKLWDNTYHSKVDRKGTCLHATRRF